MNAKCYVGFVFVVAACSSNHSNATPSESRPPVTSPAHAEQAPAQAAPPALPARCESEGVARPWVDEAQDSAGFGTYEMIGPFTSPQQYCACVDLSLAANARRLRAMGGEPQALQPACAVAPIQAHDLPSLSGAGRFQRVEFVEVRLEEPSRVLAIQTSEGWYFAPSPRLRWRSEEHDGTFVRTSISPIQARALVPGRAATIDFVTTTVSGTQARAEESMFHTVCGYDAHSKLVCTHLFESVARVRGAQQRRDVQYTVAYNFAAASTQLTCGGRCAHSEDGDCADLGVDVSCASTLGAFPFP